MVHHANTQGFSNRIALVSAPWPLFNRPSIQLGALKAYLKDAFPDLTVSCHHFFLTLAETIGYPVYQALSRETWVAESVYAALLYPEDQDRIRRFFAKQTKNSKELSGLDFADLTRRVKTASDAFIERTDWSCLDLAGFSVCLCQLTASLYFIREIKRRAPDLPVIAGGSIIAGNFAGDLLAEFPALDLIVIGEGELPLARLIRHFREGGRCRDLPPMAGIVSREGREAVDSPVFSQLPDLTALPMPDFSDYFDLLAEFPENKRFFPTLPVEASRGCWWRGGSRDTDTQTHGDGCAFCNLNLQWQGYRVKGADQVVAEVDQLTDTYKVLSVAFMDNVLPPKKSPDIFAKLAARNKDFQIFAELRASTPRRMLEIFRRAGMTEVQIGIESLSSRLLRKLNKGTTAMDNMEVMKHCEALGIQNSANLILDFPGSDAADVAETLRAIGFARIFRPLRTVHFWLGMDSPVWKNPQKFGVAAVFNHPYYRKLFPAPMARRMRFMVQDYRGDKMSQRRLWGPVVRAVGKWQQDYQSLHGDPYAGPVLTLHDGGSFLILRERRAGLEPINHRLEGTSRKIYLFCDHHRGFEEIREQFSPLPADKIQSFLTLMTGKGLMFSDNEAYLSLAVSPRPGGRHINPPARP